jgi:Flp pilus assembly pilin Flp
MTFLRKFRQFRADTSGAVTVDWVVLTAAIVGLGIAVITAFAGSLGMATDAIDEDIATASNFAETATDALNN